MTVGLKAFRDIRVAPETSGNGTKINTATQRLLGVLTAPLGGVVLHRPIDERGSLAAQRRTHIVGEDLPLTFEGDLLFDSVMYLLNMGIEDLRVGSGTPKLWVFDPDLASGRTPLAMTFQYGDNVQQFDIEYCIARQLQFRGIMNETVKMLAEMFGRNFETSTWAPVQPGAALEPHSTEVGLANKSTLFIDAAGGSPGSTRKDASLLGFTWTLDTGYRPLKYGSAVNWFDALAQGFPKVTCEMTIVFNSGMNTERGHFVSGTRRLFGLRIGGTGTDFVGLYFSGVYTSFDPLGEEDGLDVARFTVESEYDAGITTLFSAQVSNSIATLV